MYKPFYLSCSRYIMAPDSERFKYVILRCLHHVLRTKCSNKAAVGGDLRPAMTWAAENFVRLPVITCSRSRRLRCGHNAEVQAHHIVESGYLSGSTLRILLVSRNLNVIVQKH